MQQCKNRISSGPDFTARELKREREKQLLGAAEQRQGWSRDGSTGTPSKPPCFQIAQSKTLPPVQPIRRSLQPCGHATVCKGKTRQIFSHVGFFFPLQSTGTGCVALQEHLEKPS